MNVNDVVAEKIAAARARAEALRLFRMEETRTELANAPDQVDAVRELIQLAGLAA